MKENCKTKADEVFSGTNINITTEGRKYLGGFLGNPHARSKYTKMLVEKWVAEIRILPKTTMTKPQAAYAAFTSGYQHKLTYHLRTFENLFEHSHFLTAILDGRIYSIVWAAVSFVCTGVLEAIFLVILVLFVENLKKKMGAKNFAPLVPPGMTSSL